MVEMVLELGLFNKGANKSRSMHVNYGRQLCQTKYCFFFYCINIGKVNITSWIHSAINIQIKTISNADPVQYKKTYQCFNNT